MVWLYKNVKKYLNFDIRKKYDWFHSWHHFPPYNNKVLFKVDINKKKITTQKKWAFQIDYIQNTGQISPLLWRYM
jgi:hypothetical protein